MNELADGTVCSVDVATGAETGPYRKSRLNRTSLAALGLLLVFVTLDVSVAATTYDDQKTAEGWAWARIRQGEVADFNRRCGTPPLDPKNQVDRRWDNKCRKIPPRFLEQLLTRAPWREATPFKGVRILGARITGSVYLEGAKLIRPIQILGSWVEGAINMAHARTDNVVVLDGSLINGDFFARFLHADSDLSLGFGALFKRDIRIDGAKIAGQIQMVGATVEGRLSADFLQVGASLWMGSNCKHTSSFKEVVLTNASIRGAIQLSGSRYKGRINAEDLKVGGSLLMDSPGTVCEEKGEPLRLRSNYEEVNLSFAKAGQINMAGASFSGKLKASFLQVSGNLDLHGATFVDLNLSGASIAGDLKFGQASGPGNWNLNLRNAHVGNLLDAKNAWPDPGYLHLHGFTFDHLGGAEEESWRQVRERGIGWWDTCVRRDRDYSPTPYAQLATAFTNMGDRDAANDIRFRGRVRERETQRWLPRIWSGLLEYVVGFGIGTYTFRGLYFVIGISFLLALYLRICVPAVRAGGHGFLWCLGASLDRLFPVIEINKEFTDFFDDPRHERLTPRESFFYSVMRLVGLALGAVLAAAVAGLTQGL